MINHLYFTIMKKLFLFALSAMMICGCTDNDKEDNSVAFIYLSSDDPTFENVESGATLTFDVVGGESSKIVVEPYSNSGHIAAYWELTGDESWCTPSTHGVQSARSGVKFKVQPNTSSNERTATFTLTCGNVSTQLVIFQKAYTTIHNPQKGGLQSVLTELGFNGAPIKSLKITGALNDDDITVIQGMTDLINLNIRETDMTVLPESAFYRSAIENVILPKNLIEIKKNTFRESELRSIEIPASVKTIGETAFFICNSLANVTFEKESNLTTIGWWAFSCCPIYSIELPASVETIGVYAFSSRDLNAVTFEKGSRLKTIRGGAFEDAKISLLDMSECKQVEEIGGDAFAHSMSNALVKIGTRTPPKLDENAFGNQGVATLGVPAESVEAYKNSAWKFYFSNIIALDTLDK